MCDTGRDRVAILPEFTEGAPILRRGIYQDVLVRVLRLIGLYFYIYLLISLKFLVNFKSIVTNL